MTDIPSEPPPPYSPSEQQSSTSNHGAQHGTGNYRPPEHPPPPPPLPRRATNDRHETRPPFASSSSNQQPYSSAADTTPTDVPTSGRPLLREGKVLVYKPGHMCDKCGNTGYKQNDPTHPCKNCWKKYGRPWTSAIASSWPKSFDPNHPDAINTPAQNFQRPLRSFGPPARIPPGPFHAQQGSSGWMSSSHQQAGPSQSFGYRAPEAAPCPTDNKFPSGPQSGPTQWGSPYTPPPQPGYHQNPYLPPNGPRSPPVPIVPVSGYGMPPPGANVVMAGDPRIGGWLCQTCGGDGYIEPFWGFENETCRVCRGIGRVFM